MGQELRRKVEAPGSGSNMGSDAEGSATDASECEGDAPEDLAKPSRAAIAKAKAAAMDIMQSGCPVVQCEDSAAHFELRPSAQSQPWSLESSQLASI